jgi:hypothetical protein
MENKKAFANRLLYEYGLWDKLNNIGKAHIIGSYRMDMIVSNDLDIDVLNLEMSKEKLYELTKYIIETFNPVWYEAKQEVNDDGNTIWFHGFETTILGELWNVDIWFFDQDTIDKAEAFCDNIYEKIKENSAKKEAIIYLKNALIDRGLYNSEKYTSIDVYDAVLNKNIHTIDEFLKRVKSNSKL